MFRFVYAWRPGEPFDATTMDGFAGVESDDEPPTGVPWISRRHGTPGTAGLGYAIAKSEPLPAAQFGTRLRAAADRITPTLLLVPNVAPFDTAAALWTVLEAARHRAVQVALDLAAAHTAGRTAALLVPTLNLRIGLVRASVFQDDLADYARRLAGIGFEGYVVCDPPTGPDRPAAAQELALAFRAVLSVKSVKKAVPVNSARGR